MSFGFSVGDVLAAISIANQLWTACFSKVSSANATYTRYGEQIQGLAGSLQKLWEILSQHERKLQQRHGQQMTVDVVDLNALAIIVGDFFHTLKRTEKLMDKYAIFKRDPSSSERQGYVQKIRWSMDAEEEVHKLTLDCAFHMTKIQFVLEPLRLKLQFDLSDQIQGVRDDLMERLRQIETLIRFPYSDPLGITMAATPDPQQGQQHRKGSKISHSLAPTRVEARFEEMIQFHPMLDDIPLGDWTEAAAWWIENGTTRLGEQWARVLRKVPTELYINLLKAAWLLSKCEESNAFKQLQRNSLWAEYILGLTKTVADEFMKISARGLSIPDEESLLRVSPDCFFVWHKYTPKKDEVVGFRDEKQGEEKILQLALDTKLDTSQFRKELLIFRQGDGTLRVCDTTEDFQKQSRDLSEFFVNCAETQLVALYVTGYSPSQDTPAYNVTLRNQRQTRPYSFKSAEDLHNFQRAIVGAQVAFDQPGSRNLICAPSFGPALQGTSVHVQIWLDKPLQRLAESVASPNPDPFPDPKPLAATTSSAASASSSSSSSGCASFRPPLPSPSPIPTLTRTMTSLSYPSSGSFSGSSTAYKVMEIHHPQKPRLVVYFRNNHNRWMLLQIPIEDKLAIKPKRCCGNNLKRLFSTSGEVCCRRTVLEMEKGSIEALQFPPWKEEDGAALDVLKASFTEARRNAQKVTFKYVSIEFFDTTEKVRFNDVFEEIKLLRKAQTTRLGMQIQDARRQALAINSGRRSSIGSSGSVRNASFSRASTWAPSESLGTFTLK